MNKIYTKKNVIISICFLWAFMLFLNCLTQICVDDYSYHYNMKDGTEVNTILDVFRALYDHYFVQNGRLVAHLFAYVFLLMPKMVFNLFNAGVFTYTVWKIYSISKNKNEKENPLLFWMIFGCIWIVEPAFGQVNLWLDGACNYLFALAFGLVYFAYYANLIQMEQTYKNTKEKILKIIGWGIFSFAFGSYSENLSIAVGLGCFVILLYIDFYLKKKIPVQAIIGIAMGLLGYAFLVLAPSSMNNKVAFMGIATYAYNFEQIVIHYYDSFKILLVIWIATVVIGFYEKKDIRRLFTSAVCMLISVMNSVLCTFGQYISDRSRCGSVIFLVLAIAMLLYDEWETKYQPIIMTVKWSITMLTLVWMVVGVYDIGLTHQKTANLENILWEAAANKSECVTVPRVDAATRYSSSYRLSELDPDDATAWPNCDYEKYFGIKEIYGTPKVEK